MDIEDLRAHCLDLIVEINDHLKLLRDYSVTPGNSWLARSELQRIQALMSDLDASIDAIKKSEEA